MMVSRFAQVYKYFDISCVLDTLMPTLPFPPSNIDYKFRKGRNEPCSSIELLLYILLVLRIF